MASLLLLAGCTTTKVTEAPPGSGNYSTNVVVDPKLTGALETVKAVNDATAAVNPYATPINLGLGLVGAIAAWVAKRKNDKLNSSNALLKVVVQGVDQANNPIVKEAIAKHATMVGVEGELSQVVNKVDKGISL